jgi:hypothetical protein
MEPVPPQVYKSETASDSELEPCYKCGTPLIDAPGIGPFCPNKECDVLDGPFNDTEPPVELTYIPPQPTREITAEESAQLETVAYPLEEETKAETPVPLARSASSVFAPKPPPVIAPETAQLPAKPIVTVPEAIDLKSKPSLQADNDKTSTLEVNAQFGTSFPTTPNKGDLFLRVDYLPTRLFRYNGIKWMEADKSLTDTYSYNEEYIAYLVEQVAGGKYDPDDLSDSEKFQIEEFLKKNVK